MAWLKKDPKNIIVRMPNWVGDLVMAVPVLALLREKFEHAKITAMCQSNVAPLLQEDTHIDELFSFKRSSGWLHREANQAIIDPLKMGKYDLGLLLTNSLSSAFWFWKGGVKNRVGYPGHLRSSLLDLSYKKKHDPKEHLVSIYQKLLHPLGIHKPTRAPRLYLKKEERFLAESLLEKQGIKNGHVVVGINPGAAYGSAKCWLPQRFKQLTQELLKNPLVRVVYFGDPAGKKLVNDICSGLGNRVINLAGKTTLREFVALINECSIFLTNDSGPMHIAAALKIPLLALFGSTNSIRTGPYQFGDIINKNVACSPCYLRECPIDFRCMQSIEVKEVYNQLEWMIKRLHEHQS